MHAPVLKRSPMNQAIGLALIVGLLASLAIGVVTLRNSDDGATVSAPSADLSLLAKEQRFFDAKMTRLDEMEAAYGANYVPAARSTTTESGAGTIDVYQYRADQAAPSTTESPFTDMAFGQVLVDRALRQQVAAARVTTDEQTYIQSRIFQRQADRGMAPSTTIPSDERTYAESRTGESGAQEQLTEYPPQRFGKPY